MAYTPTTWVTGDDVIATKLNKIENGIANAGSVATVVVNCNGGGLSGSQLFYVGYAQHVNNVYSIESPMVEYYAVAGYQARCYIPVPLTSDEDDFKPYIFWAWQEDDIHVYTITGDISSTKITAQRKVGNNSWESMDYKGFQVMGDGQIDVAYAD